MADSLRFETPENVQVRYEVAGMGTRFVAWLLDQFVLWLLLAAVLVFLVMAGMSFDFVLAGGSDDDQAMLYFFGLMALVWGLGSFLYFGCCELLLGGQTIGKRVASIRVVKADGFQLDSASILVRNVFRVLDHLPPMWIVPVMSRRGQRAGDMVAGTLVAVDAPVKLSPVRAALADRPATQAVFRFDQAHLRQMTPHDFGAIERLLDRWPDLPSDQQGVLLEMYARQIAGKLRVDVPPADQRKRFLEDLFAAELRRRDRSLA